MVEFPAQVFSIGGQRERMHSFLAKASIVRWEINGKVFAYSYSLIPLSKACKEQGKSVYEGEVVWMVYGTFADDQGDGVFTT